MSDKKGRDAWSKFSKTTGQERETAGSGTRLEGKVLRAEIFLKNVRNLSQSADEGTIQVWIYKRVKSEVCGYYLT